MKLSKDRANVYDDGKRILNVDYFNNIWYVRVTFKNSFPEDGTDVYDHFHNDVLGRRFLKEFVKGNFDGAVNEIEFED